jgi:hypothetical protein
VKIFTVAIILCIAFCASAQIHLPSWTLIDTRQMSSFDMLTTRLGLLAINDNGYHAISKYDNGILTDVFTAENFINSLIIRDQNKAYFSVTGLGIFEASNKWKNYNLIFPVSNANIFAVQGDQILANIDGVLSLSNNGGVDFSAAKGIAVTDTVIAAEFFSTKTALAVTGKKLYRSLDGGGNWNLVSPNPRKMNSIYVDHSHKAVYIGGERLIKSFDSGATWQNINSIFFDSLPGPVLGSRDCSGTFYIGPDALTHGSELLRSVDQARFFQDAGASMFSSIRLRKAVIMDRGSTFFYLDSSGLLGIVRDGIDSTVTDSVRDRIQVVEDSAVTNSLCPGTTPTSFTVSVRFDQCTGIFLDSLKQIDLNPSFSAKFTQSLLTDAAALGIPFVFHANHSGPDTAHYRLKFHSPITGNIEQKFFDVTGFGKAGSPELSIAESQLHFPQTKADSVSILTLTINNPGCDNLIIDTTFSTNTAVFSVGTKAYPLFIAPGKQGIFAVTFTPHIAGEYLESLELHTNAGNRFITLRGSTNEEINTGGVKFKSQTSFKAYPNPTGNILHITSSDKLPKVIIIRDLLGREMTQYYTGGKNEVHLDLHALADGLYIIDLGGSNFERILIRH